MKILGFILLLGLGAVLMAGIVLTSAASKQAAGAQNQDTASLRALSGMILRAAFENEMAGRPWVFPGIAELEQEVTDEAIRSWIVANRGNLFTPLQGRDFDAGMDNSAALLLELRRPGGKALGVTVTGSAKMLN